MAARFPHRRDDGSFCVEIFLRFESEAPEQLSTRISTWLRVWVGRNQHSTWFAEDVAYEDEFAGQPSDVELGDGVLRFRMECQPNARWWKDWLVVGLLTDMQREFVEIKGVEKIGSCSE